MPIYEYKCDSCDHQFEKLMRISAEPPPCEACGETVRKLVSASGFILKGGGWYKDHYGLKGGSTSGGTSDVGGASSGTDSSSGGTGDAGGASDSGGSTGAGNATPAGD